MPVDSEIVAPGRTDWETYGICQEVRDSLPGEVCGFQLWQEDSLAIQTKQGSYFLWFYRGHEAGLAFQCQLLQIADQNSFSGFLRPVLWRDHRIYRRLDERSWLYLTDNPQLRNLHFHEPQDIRELIRLICDFRDLTHHWGLYYGRIDQPGLTRKLKSALKQIQIFSMLAQHRIRPTPFDRIYLQCFSQIRQQAILALERLENSSYGRLNALADHRDRILYDLSRHNLGITPGGHAVLLRLDKCRRDIPVVDLAISMSRTGRANEWRPAWLKMILAEYQKRFPIRRDEVVILEALLRFPWSLYRLCSRYYYNRVMWPIPQLVEKLERLLTDEPLRRRFLDLFPELAMDEI